MSEQLRIGFIPLADAATLLIAVDKGFSAAEGLDVEFVSSTKEDSAAALRSGEVDFLGASPYTGLSAFPGWKRAHWDRFVKEADRTQGSLN